MISNISSNYTTYTIMITTQDITSLLYYPLILLILTILPIIVLFTVIILKLSNRTKIFILHFNIVYSVLLPIIGAAIMTDFQLKYYIYAMILKDPSILDALYHINVALANIYQFISLLMYIYSVINTLLLIIINIPKILTYINKN